MKHNFSSTRNFFSFSLFKNFKFNLISPSFARSPNDTRTLEGEICECCKTANPSAPARRKTPLSLSSFNVNVNAIKIHFSRSLERRELKTFCWHDNSSLFMLSLQEIPNPVQVCLRFSIIFSFHSPSNNRATMTKNTFHWFKCTRYGFGFIKMNLFLHHSFVLSPPPG